MRFNIWNKKYIDFKEHFHFKSLNINPTQDLCFFLCAIIFRFTFFYIIHTIPVHTLLVLIFIWLFSVDSRFFPWISRLHSFCPRVAGKFTSAVKRLDTFAPKLVIMVWCSTLAIVLLRNIQSSYEYFLPCPGSIHDTCSNSDDATTIWATPPTKLKDYSVLYAFQPVILCS